MFLCKMVFFGGSPGAVAFYVLCGFCGKMVFLWKKTK